MLQAPRLEDVLSALAAMTPAEKAETIRLAAEATKHLIWIPNPGGQQAALESQADELFFGGEPGGGKSALLIGAAITQHSESIVFRREFPQIRGLVDEAARILNTRNGYNGQEHLWRIPGTTKTLEFGSVPHEKDVEKYQGRAHDLKGFDEITHFSRSQYRYLTLWLRSTKPEQRCRIITTGNPPRRPEGLWVIEHWAPWLDRTHPDPAKPGELRWAAPLDDETDKELFFRTKDEALAHIGTLRNPPRDPATGQIQPPRSRTFIPGKLEENQDLVKSGYGAVLAYASKDLRSLASGKFEDSLPDDEWQVLPTKWIEEAQKRWTPNPPDGAPMTSIGVDVAQGGADNTVLAPRYDHWFAPLIVEPGIKTPMPSDVAALVVKHRRDRAAVVVDCGGGYGGGVVERLQDNSIPAVKYLGAAAGVGRTKCRTYGFANKRAMSYWRFREALNPDQPGGSPIALPTDPGLRADLAAARFEITPRNEIKIEDKEDIKKRIGRSPDRADAVIEAWDEGNAAVRRGLGGLNSGGGWSRPQVQGLSLPKRRRR